VKHTARSPKQERDVTNSERSEWGKVAIGPGHQGDWRHGIARPSAGGGSPRGRRAIRPASRAGADKVRRREYRSGGRAVRYRADAQSGDVQRLFAEAKKHVCSGSLVNNAGVYQFAPLEAVTEEEFHREFKQDVGTDNGPRKRLNMKHCVPTAAGLTISARGGPARASRHVGVYTATTGAGFHDVQARPGARGGWGPKKSPASIRSTRACRFPRAARTAGIKGSEFEKQMSRGKRRRSILARGRRPSAIARFLASHNARGLTARSSSRPVGYR